ncbi:MOSC domain-containing protein 1, mitochondrial [Harpegnathos saltator]|uniref:MOSC domain-containing protein 1, mitochondrial n=1 Tax=Harpegnathos saltator TaxID=610380 RepID=E2BE07_HARSA|nr:MOSC domain-containing protein 1, mitochondrial [Harpegnathos saltator]
MFVIYDDSTKCTIQDKKDPRLNSLEMIPMTEYKIKLAGEGMPDLVLDIMVIQNISTRISALTSSHDKFLIGLNCIDCGTKAAAWISRYLQNSNARLGYNIPQNKSLEPFEYKYNFLKENNVDITVPYENFPSCQLLSENSLSYVNSRLNHSVHTNDFQANIVFAPFHDTSFTEFKWEWINIGNAIMKNVKPWL